MKYILTGIAALLILSACKPSQNAIDNCVKNSNYAAERCKTELSR